MGANFKRNVPILYTNKITIIFHSRVRFAINFGIINVFE